MTNNIPSTYSRTALLVVFHIQVVGGCGIAPHGLCDVRSIHDAQAGVNQCTNAATFGVHAFSCAMLRYCARCARPCSQTGRSQFYRSQHVFTCQQRVSDNSLGTIQPTGLDHSRKGIAREPLALATALCDYTGSTLMATQPEASVLHKQVR